MTQRQHPRRPLASVAVGAFRFAGAGAAATVRFGARRPLAVLASVAILGGAGVFAWNATMTQSGRHPAPLFADRKPIREARSEQARRLEAVSPQTTGATRPDVPSPPPRPSGPDAIGSIIRTAEPRAAEPKKVAETRPRPAEVRRAPETAPKVAEVRKAADAKPAPDAKPSAQPRVASAQKALSKLGYGPITADGLLGTATRSALERFERDKSLPVTGDLGAKTSKRLASLSGIAVE